jgi:hypothetical protein
MPDSRIPRPAAWRKAPVKSQQPSAGSKKPLGKKVLFVRRLQAVDGRLLTLLTSYCQKPPNIKRKDRVDMLPDPFSFPMPETRNPLPAVWREAPVKSQQPSADSKKSRGKKGSLRPQAAGCRRSATDASDKLLPEAAQHKTKGSSRHAPRSFFFPDARDPKPDTRGLARSASKKSTAISRQQKIPRKKGFSSSAGCRL